MKRTPLYEKHIGLRAQMTEFGGWEMPLRYEGILEEHRAVREAAGLFDVSHMGEIAVQGPGARSFLQKMLTNDLSKAAAGRCVYSPVCYPDGGTVDDLLVYVRGEDSFLLVVNAANSGRDFDWFREHRAEGAALRDASDETVQLALQGPKAQEILQKLTDVPLGEIGFYRFREGVTVGGAKAIVSRTGYTGSDGFEIYMDADQAAGLWDKVLEAGAKDGLRPAGLGARDTLRLEAALPLYGHELSAEITPLEAGLSRFVKLAKEDFIGKPALEKQAEVGVPRRLFGLRVTGKGIARAGFAVKKDGETIGAVTSGGYSPTLGGSVALALADRRAAVAPGDALALAVRGREIAAAAVQTPFYSVARPGGKK